MTEHHNSDPVLISVNAYSNDPTGYRDRYQHHRLELPARFNELLPLAADVLDLGCGPGRDLDYFASCGHRVTGVELNPDFFAMCQQNHSVVQVDVRDVQRHLLPESFDGIWAQASLVHLSVEEVAGVLVDCFDLLRNEGLLYLSVPSDGVSGWKVEPDGRRWYTVWPDDTIVSPLEAAGFTIFDISHGPYVEAWARA